MTGAMAHSTQACNLAAYFSQLGITAGDRVALLLSQSPEASSRIFACYRIGAIALPLFTLFGVDALQYRLADSGAKLLVTDLTQTDKITALDGQLPGLKNLLVCGGATGETRSVSSLKP